MYETRTGEQMAQLEMIARWQLDDGDEFGTKCIAQHTLTHTCILVVSNGEQWLST